MGLGDLIGNAASMLGGTDNIMAKLEEFGIDPAELASLDAEGITTMLEEKGIDLSMLETFGISVEDILAKIKGA